MKLHKEGPSTILVVLGFIAVLNGLAFGLLEFEALQWLVVLFSIFLFFFILQFFRNPDIQSVTGEELVIAPADGKVVVIEETQETEYFNDRRIQVSIFMSPVNVHVNRNPVSGIISYFKYHPGKFLVAWHPKSSTDNERTTLVYKKQNGTEILIRQIAGAVARRIKWYVNAGDQVNQSEEFGFIKFGSRVDVFLPLGTELKVDIDDVTEGGRTILATL